MKRFIKCVTGVLVVLLAGTAVQAKLQLVVNFDGFTGNPDGQACNGVLGGTLDTNTEGTGNSSLPTIDGSTTMSVIGHSSGTIDRAIGVGGINNPIENTETGIGFFRLRVSAGNIRPHIGLVADTDGNPVNATNNLDPLAVPAGVRLVANGAGFDVVTADGATVLKAGFATTQWYNVWIVANNETDTFDLYMSEAPGPDGAPSLPGPQDLVKAGIPFNVPTTDPLNGMIFANPRDPAGTAQAARIHVDEIWWDGDQGLAPPTKARNPNPANGATDVYRDAVLSWMPGPSSATHNVYLGTSFSEVSSADTTSPLLVGPAQTSNTYDPGRLALDLTYYWRVDEVNAPPDSTVFKGDVWSFTTEPVGYPIESTNIAATASSAAQADFGPENTINGSGLDPNGLHSTQPMDMWLTDNEAQGAWIQYEFDTIYRLHEMWVWNSNQVLESFFGFGIKDATVEYSTDGTAWTALAGVPEFTRAPGADRYAHNTTVDFDGAEAKYVRLTATSNWGGILPQYGLSEVRFFYIPVVARAPSPDSGATDVDPDVTLTWRAGREAGTHDMYLSTDEQAVTDGTIPAVSLTEASYSLALDLSSKYYWRVDEVNESETPSIWQGDVWSFSSTDSIIVEDFESYNDIDPPDPTSHRIFETWIDGYNVTTNGALVGNDLPPYMERTIVYGGSQSMPLFYSNTGGAAYSEATRTFAVPQDWTRYGVQTLTLYFSGDVGNTGQLYIKVNGVKVLYDGDPTDIAKPLWNHWSIELASLGVNLQNITTLTLGIDGTGAAGTLYVDEIGLALDFPATGLASGSILFVSSLDPSHMPGDNAIKAFLERLGHAVTYIDDNADEASTEAKAAVADLVFISESVGSGEIYDEITEIETPIIVAEPYAWDEMGLTTGTPQAINQVPASLNITIVGAGHPLAAGYTGDVPVFTALSASDALIPVGTAAGGAVVIARASGDVQSDADVYFVYEKGAALAAPPTDGSPQTAAEMRIGFFAASPIAEMLLSDEGYDLLSAAVNYALGLSN